MNAEAMVMEIEICFLLCKHILRVAKDKNYNPVGFIIGTIVTWIIAESVSAVISLLLGQELLLVYLVALVGGCLGGLVWLMIIHIIPSQRYNPEERIIFDAYRLRHIEDPAQLATRSKSTRINSSVKSGDSLATSADSPDEVSPPVCPICLEPTENGADFCRTCGYRLTPCEESR